MDNKTDPSIVGYTVCEFYGTGDPFFGGTASDRPLGVSGEFLSGTYHLSQVAQFADYWDAERAAYAAANRRRGGKIGIIPVRDYSKVREVRCG